jgi:hypothetical protein
MVANHLVGNGIVTTGNRLHVLAGLLGSLANALGNFLGLAITNTDVSFAVTNNHQGRKTEPASTGNDFSTPVNVNDLFEESVFILFNRGTKSTALSALATLATATGSAPTLAATARSATGSTPPRGWSWTVHLSDNGTLTGPCFGFGRHDVRTLWSRGAGHRDFRGFGFWSLIVFFSH